MERPHDMPKTRELQWTTRPSEEQLLGSPLLATTSRPAVSFEPRPPHDWATTEGTGSPHEPEHASPRWRPQARDLTALAAVAAAVWFAVNGVERAPSRSVEGATPTTAHGVAARVLADRNELSSLPREARTATANGTAAAQGQDGKHKSGSAGSSGSGGKGDGYGKPGGGGGSGESQDALVQATVLGVGSVTVEQPKVPETGLPVPDVPDLPKTEVAVPGTATVSLP